MWIFAGVRWPGGFKMKVESTKIAIFAYFTYYNFRISTSKATIIILCHVVPHWLFSDIEIDDFE